MKNRPKHTARSAFDPSSPAERMALFDADAARSMLTGGNAQSRERAAADQVEKEAARLDAEALGLYTEVARTMLDVPCEGQVVHYGGRPFPEVQIAVPSEIERPFERYHEQLERIHQTVEQRRPDLGGRVTWKFVRTP